MKAWEMEKQLMESSVPRILTDEEQTWKLIEQIELDEDMKIKMLWYSEVPGSGAKERLIVGAVQSVENMGMDVNEAEELIPMGINAYEQNKMVELHKITSIIFHKLTVAKKDDTSPYWSFKSYKSWTQYTEKVSFPPAAFYDVFSKEYKDKILAGWIAQICGGALGTAIEGYTSENLNKAFGEIQYYVRTPNTFNDDITYELAFLKAFTEKGYAVDSIDIAEEWVALVPFGWSAEDIALKNIKMGIYPPESGSFHNPYNEWIGAQMRGAICGMAAPGNPEKAASLAWRDGVISHSNNGVMGEIFNAVLVSLAFVQENIKTLIKEAAKTVPCDCEYYSVISYTLEQCENNNTWQKAWKHCEKKFERYNWIHAYPNAAAEVVALWYGDGDFDETMHIIAMEGQDVDCNAAQIGTIIGIIRGMNGISEKWQVPIGDELYTYVRGMKKLKISELAEWTVDAVKKAYEDRL